METNNPHHESFLKRRGKFLGFLIGMASLGFLAQFQWVGHVGIFVYALIALRMRIPARVTFTAALVALAMVPLAIILANWIIAQNFAAYAFMLFVFGILSMTIDLQREIRLKK